MSFQNRFISDYLLLLHICLLSASLPGLVLSALSFRLERIQPLLSILNWRNQLLLRLLKTNLKCLIGVGFEELAFMSSFLTRSSSKSYQTIYKLLSLFFISLVFAYILRLDLLYCI